MNNGHRIGALTAQVLAQALGGWALLATLLESGWLSGFVLLAALVVPFRTDGSLRDRAVSNFAAGLLVWGVLSARLLDSFLETLIWGPGEPVLSVLNLIMLTMTVLYVFAGAFFWVEREGRAFE